MLSSHSRTPVNLSLFPFSIPHLRPILSSRRSPHSPRFCFAPFFPFHPVLAYLPSVPLQRDPASDVGCLARESRQTAVATVKGESLNLVQGLGSGAGAPLLKPPRSPADFPRPPLEIRIFPSSPDNYQRVRANDKGIPPPTTNSHCDISGLGRDAFDTQSWWSLRSSKLFSCACKLLLAVHCFPSSCSSSSLPAGPRQRPHMPQLDLATPSRGSPPWLGLLLCCRLGSVHCGPQWQRSRGAKRATRIRRLASRVAFRRTPPIGNYKLTEMPCLQVCSGR